MKLAISALGGAVFSWLGSVWGLAFFAFFAILLDYGTGMLAGRANEGLDSKRAQKGIYRKVGFLALLCLGFFLDGAFNHFIARGFSFQMPFDLPFGLVVALWIVITEAISICENIQRLGVDIPPWLLNVLRGAKSSVNKEDGGGEGSGGEEDRRTPEDTGK